MRLRLVVLSLVLAMVGIAGASPVGRSFREMVSNTIKTADQVFQGSSPSAVNQLACSTDGVTGSWNSATTCAVAPASNAPTASGNVLCGTSASAASFQAPGTCGLATGTNFWTATGSDIKDTQAAGHNILADSTSSSTATPKTIGFTIMGAGNASRYHYGDLTAGSQFANGDLLQFWSTGGISFSGGRASSSAPAFVSANGASDFSVIVNADATGGGLDVEGGASAGPALKIRSASSGTGLRIDSSAGSVGSGITFSGRATTTNPGAVAANTCNNVALTVTGAVVNAECHKSLPAAFAVVLNVDCFVSATNTVQLRLCNNTAASVTPTVGTYSVRVWNP